MPDIEKKKKVSTKKGNKPTERWSTLKHTETDLKYHLNQPSTNSTIKEVE